MAITNGSSILAMIFIGPDYDVTLEVDNKSAHSVFTHINYKEGCSLLDVQLLTGRKHQIRQHLSAEGFPIVGDRLYGNGTTNTQDRDLQLQSVSLQFTCPITEIEHRFTVDESQRLHL